MYYRGNESDEPDAAPQDGTVKEILVENAQPVEFDQPLFVVS